MRRVGAHGGRWIGCVLMGAYVCAAPQETFRVSTDVISIDVAVQLGRNPVLGLTSGDFVLEDNGVRQDIEALTTDGLPLDVTLAGDVSGSVADDLDRFKTTIRRMAADLRPVDRVRVVTFGGLIRQIEPMQAVTSALALDGLRAEESTVMTDGLFYALSWPPQVGRRHLIVTFTDGSDTSSALDSALLPDLAAHTDAVLYVVLAKNRGSSRANDRSVNALKEAATRTGGSVHELGDALKSFEEVLAEFRTSYVLRYTWHGVKREGWHDVRVTLARPGTFVIRARKGYFGGETRRR